MNLLKDSNPIKKIDKILRNNGLSGNIMPEVSLKADLKGKVKNLPHFKTNALLPVFEAVVNSIHSIEESNDAFNTSERGHIIVKVIRENKTLTEIHEEGIEEEEKEEKRKIMSFEIEDDGIGFNDINFDSFCTSDTTYKSHKGCKGVGRFVWLKAFEKVEIDSIYSDNGINKRRQIDFSLNNNTIIEKNELANGATPRTIVRLKGFKKEYQNQSSAFKTKSKIAQRILEHNLSYYIGEEAPSILVTDEEQSISLDTIFSDIKSNIFKESIQISGELFNITHVKLPSTTSNVHNIVLCADNREVLTESIQKYLDTSFLVDDDGNKFYYAVYVSSNYLDVHVNITRTSFDIDEQTTISDFQKEDKDKIITIERIRDEVLNRSKEYLSHYIEAIETKKHEKIANFIASNPSLRAVPKYCSEIYDEIQVNSSDDVVNEVLYKYKGKAELSIKREHEKLLLKTQSNSFVNLEDEVKKLTEKIEAFNKDNLTGYIIRRKLILDLLEKKLQLNTEGKYHNEDIIHDIIFPRSRTTDEIAYEDHNLWIIDEQLTFHHFAASDKLLNAISSSDSEMRPDIIICSEKDDDGLARSISIIEFKKPQRPSFDKDPITQMYDTIRKIKNHKIKTMSGRCVLVDAATKYYCYAICDRNTQITEYIENNSLSTMKDNLGYYTYNPTLNAHVELLIYDKIIIDATKRHKIFFEKLGIPQNI